MLVSLTVVTISQCIHISKHHIVNLKYISFLFVNYASVKLQEVGGGTSLVVQWLRIRLPMQGTGVQALVQEDLTCRRATKPMHHNY